MVAVHCGKGRGKGRTHREAGGNTGGIGLVKVPGFYHGMEITARTDVKPESFRDSGPVVWPVGWYFQGFRIVFQPDCYAYGIGSLIGTA